MFSTTNKKEFHEAHLVPSDYVTDDIVRRYGGPGSYPKTSYLRSFSVENVWSGSSNGTRTVQFARKQEHSHSSEGKCEYTVAASCSPGHPTLLGRLSDMFYSEPLCKKLEQFCRK